MFHHWSQDAKFTPQHKQILKNTVIDREDGPGTILKDFENLLTYIQEKGLKITKKQNVPYSLLPELNALLEHPIEHGLTRPQLKSFPPLYGLYLLLRASGLTYLDASGSTYYLQINEKIKQTWDELNPTERYFSLLETWLLRGSPDILGENGGLSTVYMNFYSSMAFLKEVSDKGMTGEQLADYYLLEKHSLGLLYLFGIIDVKSAPPVKGEGWQIDRIYRTPFGEALFTLLYKAFSKNRELLRLFPGDTKDTFGKLQPGCTPYFPEWKNNLGEVEGWAFREGVHVFKVSLGRIWRRIAIPAEQTLEALAHAILRSMQFDSDHLYQFSYQNHKGIREEVCHPYMDQKPSTDEVQVGEVPLLIGHTMTYWFDFGDDWKFKVKLEKVDPDMDIDKVTLLEEKGESPEQYPGWG